MASHGGRPGRAPGAVASGKKSGSGRKGNEHHASLNQQRSHHPDIDIRFSKVTLTLSTHDEGGITEKDFSLARQCDAVFFKPLVS